MKFNYPLTNPVKINGADEEQTITELNFDFDKITGGALLSLSSELDLDDNGVATFTTPIALNAIAAKAAGYAPSDLHNLSGPDSLEVMAISQSFLSGTLHLTKYVSQETDSENESSNLE